MPFAATRLVVHIALTCALPVTSGVDSTVVPRASMTGRRPVMATQSRNSLIALRICPGMSNMPGSPSSVVGAGAGDGAGDGAGGDDGTGGVGPPGGGVGIGDGTPGAGVGVGDGVTGAGDGTPGAGTGA